MSPSIPNRKSLSDILKLSLPLIAGQVGQVLVSVSDNIMVGRLGTVELAAISLAIAIFSIFFVVGLGLSFALPPLVAEAYGKKDPEGISRSLANSQYINLTYSILVLLLTEIAYPLMYHLGQEPEVVELAIPYLRLSVISILPFMIFQGFRSLSDGMGNTKVSMQALLIGNALNILLNYLLIFGKLGFPAMGVMGAGLSSLISRTVMLMIWMGLIWKKPEFRSPVVHLLRNQWDWPLLKKLFGLGAVTSLQFLFEVGLFSASTVMMGMIGEVPQAAHQIALNLVTVTFMVTTGFALAATVKVGQLLGSGDGEEIGKAGFSAIGLSAVFMFLAGILILLTRHFLPYLYIDEVEVVELAAQLLIFAAIFQISDGVQVSALGALRGLQDVRIPALYTFIAYQLVGVPLAWILAFFLGFGPSGIWIGLVAGLTFSAVLNTLRFRKLQIRMLPETRIA